MTNEAAEHTTLLRARQAEFRRLMGEMAEMVRSSMRAAQELIDLQLKAAGLQGEAMPTATSVDAGSTEDLVREAWDRAELSVKAAQELFREHTGGSPPLRLPSAGIPGTEVLASLDAPAVAGRVAAQSLDEALERLLDPSTLTRETPRSGGRS